MEAELIQSQVLQMKVRGMYINLWRVPYTNPTMLHMCAPTCQPTHTHTHTHTYTHTHTHAYVHSQEDSHTYSPLSLEEFQQKALAVFLET